MSPSSKGSLLVVFLTVFIDLLGFGMVLPLLPIYAKQFVTDSHGVTLGLLSASFSAMQFVFAPVWGRVSDRLGRRPVLLLGLAGSVVFYTLFGLATMWRSLTWMFISRVGAGIAGATIPTAQAYIADSTTPENRTRGMALIGAAFGLGFTFGPLLGAAALWTAGDAGLSPWPGYLAAGLSLFALLVAAVRLPESRQPGAAPSARRLLDLAALGRAMAVPTVGALIVTSFVTVLSFGSFEAVLAFLLKAAPAEGGFGFEYRNVLLMFALLGFAHAAAQGLVRGLAGRMSERWLATFGAVVSIAGFGLLVAATLAGSLGLFLVAMMTNSVGFAFMPASLQSLISRRSDPARQGEILGVSQGMSALARILAHLFAIPLFYRAAVAPFAVGAGLMALALLLIAVNTRRGTDFENHPATAEALETVTADASC